jgi:hypothetical protein
MTSSIISDSPARSSNTLASPSSSSAVPAPTPTAAQTNYPPFANDGKRIHFITGLTLGSIIGIIFLGHLVYWLCALRRGVNVCNCFCSAGHKKHKDNALPKHTRMLLSGYKKPLPRNPDMFYLVSGIGAAPRMDGVIDGRQVGEKKLQRESDFGCG